MNTDNVIRFLVGVVVVGIILNIASEYIRRWLERRLIRFSKTMRDKAATRESERMAIIRSLQEDKNLHVNWLLLEVRRRLMSMACMIIGSFMITFSFLGILYFRTKPPLFAITLVFACFGFGFISQLVGISIWLRADAMSKLLRAADGDSK